MSDDLGIPKMFSYPNSRRCLAMSMNSRSDWLKSGAEHYWHCCQWMEKASACLCSHKGLIFWIFTVSSWTTGQLH